MNVLVIPEDFRKDRYVLEPIVGAMLAYLGKPRAKVRTCLDPLLGGIDQALNWERLSEILDRYPMVDLFLLVVDRDGVAGRRKTLDHIESRGAQALPAQRRLLAENAWQEIEVWVLAACDDLPTGWSWADIRNEGNPKEAYFLPYSRERGVMGEPGQGRKTLGKEAGLNYTRVRSLCPEDVTALETKIGAWVGIP